MALEKSAVCVETMLKCWPFSFVLCEGRIAQLGKYFARHHPALAGARYEDAFPQNGGAAHGPVARAPAGNATAACCNERVELRLGSGMHIVGSFLPIDPRGECKLFIGTLSPGQVSKVTDFGLTLSDFGPFDVCADFVMMAQVNEAVLKDTRLLNERLAAARDEAVRARKEIEGIALVDSLSGLANRASFQRALAGSGLDPGTPCSLLLIDIDNFKPVNDHYGHAVGDLLIRCLGERIKQATAGSEAYRIGGDEFAVIYRELTPYQAKRRAANVMRAVHAVHHLQDKRLTVEASGGLASRMFGVSDLESLYKAADIALFEAKRSRSMKLQVFTAGMGRRQLEQKLLERDLVEAVRNEELEVFIQPQFDIDTGVLSGGEALARWWNRRLERHVPPTVFIPIAETYGLVAQIDLFVLASVLRQQRSLGAAAPKVKWSTNMSPLTIAQKDLAHRIGELMEVNGSPTAPIEIEITERAVLSNSGAVDAALRAIRAMGIEVAIDDFGAGQTSLSHLTRLPITRMKLDRSLIERIDKDARAETIVHSIVELARELGLRVTAEGIERVSQAERLRRMGPMKVQGFLYAHPMPMADFAALLEGSAQASRGGRAAAG